MKTAHLRDMLNIKLFSLSDGKPSQAEFVAVHIWILFLDHCLNLVPTDFRLD